MKLSDFERNRTNPFLDKALDEVQISRKYKTATRTGESAMLQAFDPKTGEILGHTMFIREIEVDEEKFTKLYLSQFESFWELSKSCMDSDTRPAPLATAPKISAMSKFDKLVDAKTVCLFGVEVLHSCVGVGSK